MSLCVPLQSGSVYLYLLCFCGSDHALSFLITRVHRPEGRAESARVVFCKLSLSNGGRSQGRILLSGSAECPRSLIQLRPLQPVPGCASPLSWNQLPLRQEEPVAPMLDLEQALGLEQ